MTEREFTSDWFSWNIAKWEQMFQPLKDRGETIRCLEIGSWEGRSACWLADFFGESVRIECLDLWDDEQIYERFLFNTEQLRRTGVIQVDHSLSLHGLIARYAHAPQQYDLIYIDGDHEAAAVLEDAALSFRLLKPNGMMGFDDYRWPDRSAQCHPSHAIDAFLTCYESDIDVIDKDYQVWVRRKNSENLGPSFQLREPHRIELPRQQERPTIAGGAEFTGTAPALHLPNDEYSAGQESAGLRFVGSPGFTQWLADENVSLAITSYRSGKIFFVGLNDDGSLSVFERTFARCMGMWSDGQTIWVATLYAIWRFENVLRGGRQYDGYDRCYVPVASHTTGDVNAHDVAVHDDGRVIFINTLFNCLAAIDPAHSFATIWRPPFISRLVAEDRCHLNGLAMAGGKPKYCSMFAETDEKAGWRAQRISGGGVMDLETNQYVVRGISMPHSPRLYRDRLWLLQSGTGDIGYVDQGRFEPVAFCGGYVRGLAFSGDYAVVGTSKGREQNLFEELPLYQRLSQQRIGPTCGLSIVNLTSGEIDCSLAIEGLVTQLYDVVVLPGAKRPMAIGTKTDEIHRMISIGENQPL